MCGRYTVAVDPQLLAERFDVVVPEDFVPRFNVAPTDPRARADASAAPGASCMRARWGLVPHWAKDAKIGARMINARAETLTEKPAYSPLLAKNRCLILADGFYEWRLDPDGKKRPVRYTLARRRAVRLRRACGRAGAIPRAASSCAPARSSRRRRTRSSRPCTTACR